MSTAISCFKKSPLILSLFFFIFLAASHASAFDWIVTFPADVEYSKCKIIAYDSKANFQEFEITRGGSYAWHSGNNGANPISYIDGRCQVTAWGSSYFTRIKGRTCTGTDYQDSMQGGISCSNNVSVKICKKGNGIGEWSHGFCPN
ncbi:MAG: hypothetical protein CVU71_07920 [Deltaproteobacteria bacterium HGW-Deltaproteobacteria-6]|jgi:hypothetical protein|nr:MAG: hypothetical protein CVU71_07920 [Deltaproteobacteria bacterium HGW-Deltaproteobacteria-6]